MTQGDPPAAQAKHFSRNDALAMQADQAVHRADELMIGITPAHQLGNRQLAHRLRDDFAKTGVYILTLLRPPCEEVLAFRFARPLQLGKRNPGRPHETLECPGGPPFAIDRPGDRRSLLFDHSLGLALADPGDRNGEAARSGVRRADAIRMQELLRPQG